MLQMSLEGYAWQILSRTATGGGGAAQFARRVLLRTGHNKILFTFDCKLPQVVLEPELLRIDLIVGQ